MHTIKLELDDTLYDNIVKKGVNIQEVMKDALNKVIYKKEYTIANDINISLKDMNSAKSKPISELFSEL